MDFSKKEVFMNTFGTNLIWHFVNPLVGTTSESGRLLIWAKRPKAVGDSRACSAVPYMEIFVNIASVLS